MTFWNIGRNAFSLGIPETESESRAHREGAGRRYILLRKGGGGTPFFQTGTHSPAPTLSLSPARSRAVCGWHGHEKVASQDMGYICIKTQAHRSQTQTERERAGIQRRKYYGVSYNMDFTTFAVNHQKRHERGGKKAGEGLDFI